MSDQTQPSSPPATVDFSKIVSRLKEICSNPTGFWGAVRSENSDIPTIYREYLLMLAAISPVAGLLVKIYSGAPIFSSLVAMGVQYGLALGFYFAVAILIELLGPRFDCAPTRDDAFRWLAFSAFPALASGVLLLLLPLFGVFALVLCFAGAGFSIYILWHGMSEMIGVSNEKRGPFFICIVGCVIVFGVLLQSL